VKGIFAKKDPVSRAALKYRKKFLHFFPEGFRDKKYEAWERNYKMEAHRAFQKALNHRQFEILLHKRKYS
jgi:hypothetical protein